MNPSEKVVTLLQSLLSRREREQAAVRTARVLGRHEDGTERLQRTDAACVTRAPRDNHYAGTVVVAPRLAPFHRTGSTGIATLTEVASAATLWIERLDPSDYRPGKSYTVTVTGRGFDERVRIEFLEPPIAGPPKARPSARTSLSTPRPSWIPGPCFSKSPSARAPASTQAAPPSPTEGSDMALTQLPNRKPDAYTVDIQLEAREKILPSSKKATTWDLHGNRLLYTRDVWRYKVLAGSNTIQDFGHVDTEVMAIAAAELPMTSAAQGTRVALIDHIAVNRSQSNSSVRIPEVLAADPTTGNWIVYSNRVDLAPPYITDLAAYNPAGGPISTTSLVQPDDVGLRWEVPHAVLQDGFLYAIERDFRANPAGSNAPGIVVRRQIGTVGSLSIWWSAEDEWIFPHSVSVSEEHVFVAATKLFNPGGFGTFQRSYLYWLNNETLAQADVRQLKFNPTDDDFPRPFKVGGWEPTGSRNTGGVVLYDPRAGNFLAAGLSPDGYNPNWFVQSPTRALFRFAPALLGSEPLVHLADVADDLPIPMSFTATGVCANDRNRLPEFRDL